MEEDSAPRNSHLAQRTTPALKPRKQPVQARSEFTVQAILDASIQVLVASGYRKFTTTRVAERAGTSVGTLYQYFPNRQALIRSVLIRYLDGIASEIERVCARLEGQPLNILVPAWVDAFVTQKCCNIKVSRAMHEPLSDPAIEQQKLVQAVLSRVVLALAANLRASPDAPSGDPIVHAQLVGQACSAVLQTAIAKGTLSVDKEFLRSHLIALVRGYLRERGQ
jgi:AcrR family transcriptional regulator